MTTRKILTLKKPTGAVPDTTREKASPPGRDQERQKATQTGRKPQLQTPSTRTPPTTIKAQALLARLIDDHPGLFPLEGPVTPWAIGIHKAIMHHYRVSKRVTGKALRMWLAKRGEEYREAVDRGEPRVGM